MSPREEVETAPALVTEVRIALVENPSAVVLAALDNWTQANEGGK